MDVLRPAALVFAMALLLACSRPTYPECGVRCATDEVCPDGTNCINGFCSANQIDCAPFKPELPFGLIGHWPLDELSGETAFDEAGDSDGALVGDPQRIEGRFGRALQFDGITDFVLLGDPADLNRVGPISLAAWVRWDGQGSVTQNVLARGFSDPAPSPELFLRLSLEDGRYQGGTFSDGRAGIALRDVSVEPLIANEWVHLTLTNDGGRWRLFVDGDERGQRADEDGAIAIDSTWAIGGRGDGGQRYFSGAIDDVRIYDRALNEDEARSLAGL